jgi:autotransporter-associated beta strand protein
MMMKRLLTDLRRSARVLLCVSLFMWTCVPASAQRVTDNLDRGLVAVNMGGSTFLSWRILADEYFGVTYNVYRDGVKLNPEPLTVSNYTDSGVGMNYTVKAVVNGMEQSQSASISSLWPSSAKGNSVDMYLSGRIDLTLATVYDRNGNDVTANYSPNDAEFADLDGDGQLEMIIKRLNTVDAANVYPQSNTTEFVVIDAYDINWQRGTATLMWRIDCGPNMVSLNSTEINVIAYDWDMDGKAEVVLRGADNMIVYGNDGRNQLYTIGDMAVNTRNTFDPANGAQYAWTHTGNEYLLYLNGQTGALYQQMDYPLKRLEYASNLPAEWGGRGYGHNSSKYFFGAPYFDGRKPSLFMARGIYGTHKMIAMDLSNGQWTETWRWNCRDTSSPWYGQGYHNFVVADVDEDGRDEIVYGSMVIDDNGKGLHTTGYGHGDAQHVSDFDPYRKGLEFFGCLEDEPSWGCDFRDATTGEVLYKFTAGGDDGRCMMDNISNNYPGSLGHSSASPTISSATRGEVSEASSIFHFKSTNISLNFRIYWDGDLLSELLDSPGTMGSPMVFKPEVGRLLTGAVGNMNNDSKNNACFQGDIIGDWREEIVVRNGSNAVSIYTSVIPSENPIPCLWFDHQYRQAMVWQMMAYNQPPHVSYFLGELEGYTTAPPPSTMAGRLEISNGGTIAGSSGDQLIACETNNMTISVSNGAQPSVFIDNAPSWVQGTDVNGTTGTRVTGNGEVAATNLPPINRTYYTHTLTGGAFAGNMWLVKQGDGTLVLPKVTETYTGRTDVWAGTLQFDGTMQSSPVWMNRHTTLNTTGGTFGGGLTMEYGATLNMGGETSGTVSAATVSNLTLNYGSQVVFDVAGTNQGDNDLLTVGGTLTVDQKTGGNWETYGPEHLSPVFVVRSTETLESGDYPIGVVEAIEGEISNIKLNTVGLNSNGLATLVYDSSTKILYFFIDDSTMPDYGGELSINVTGMAPTEVSATDYPSAASETFYLPVVSVTALSFSGITPTVSGTFTPLGGTETDLGTSGTNTLYSEDYESATDASAWTNGAGTLEQVSGDATYGSYIHHSMVSTNIAANRSAYTLFGNMDFANVSQYNIEFDTRITAGNVADRSVTDLVVMTNDATIPTTKNIGYDFSQNNETGSNYLFRLKAANSQVFTINDGTETITLDASKWYHIKLLVDVETKTVGYNISQGNASVASGTFTVPTSSCLPKGLFILDGRGSGDSKFDNINVYYTKDFSSYTFTEPGMLTLKASVPGYKSKTETFTVPAVYYKYYESPDYNQIQAADAASVLGSDYWNEETTTSRWGNWSKTNGTYGENYVMATGKQTSGYFDKDKVLQISYNQSTVYNQLVQGFGIGHNKTNSTCDITAERLGNSNSILYYKADLSRGGAVNYDEGYTFASDDGKFSYTLSETTTFCKFAAYLPVMLSDEESSLGTVASDCGNALVYRTGLGSGWGTMVLPYSMTADQLRDAFGDDVKVANLTAVDGTVLMFDETTQAVTGGVPFLISGVTKSGPFVAKGVTDITTESSKSVGGIDFIGTYTNMGSTPFTTKDYFFVTNSNKLTRVSRDGMKMVLKGYRAYFHDSSAAGAKSFTVSIGDSEATGIDDINGEEGNHDVYDLQGRKVASDLPWSEAKRLLRQGVYIVNGKRMIVK